MHHNIDTSTDYVFIIELCRHDIQVPISEGYQVGSFPARGGLGCKEP